MLGTEKNKNLEIEYLRGVAVLFVMIHHAHGNLLSVPPRFFDLFHQYFGLGVGVDIFFAISGFVIARSLIPRLMSCASPSESIGEVLSFWIRRFWRLIPSAWFWLILVLIAATFFNHSGVFGSVRANVEATLAGFFQFANFRFANTFGRTEYGATFVYWSLSLEEQFYLIFPFLILFSRNKLPWLLACIALIQLVSHRSLLSLSLRTDALAIGALIAWWQSKDSYQFFAPRFLRHAWVSFPVVVGLLVLVGCLGSPNWSGMTYRFSLISAVSALLVFIASYGRGYIFLPKSMSQIFLWVGARSYALYLVHVPVFFLVREIFYRAAKIGFLSDKDNAIYLVLFAGCLIVIFAEGNYRFIEQPLRKYGARVSSQLLRRAQSGFSSRSLGS